ncbi:MAG: cytochrome C, partial [Chitinophagaceae bacterium]
MKANWFPVLLFIIIIGVLVNKLMTTSSGEKDLQTLAHNFRDEHATDSTWAPPSTATSDEVNYGRELIAHTAKYLGPNGSVAKISNGMNCQNCHLDAGSRPWGNDFSGVYATYPQFRPRSNSMHQIANRVNDCLERSLNGTALDTNSREMQAIAAYMIWLGSDVPLGTKPRSAGLPRLPVLMRAADAEKGRIVYRSSCQRCHGANGEGKSEANQLEYIYPPLWGEKSYNDGAGL